MNEINKYVIKAFCFLYFVFIGSILNGQNFLERFNQHLDSTKYYEFSVLPNPSEEDQRFLDSIRKFIHLTQSDRESSCELKSAMESFIQNEEFRYCLSYPLFKLYIDHFKGKAEYLPFILNNAFEIVLVGTDWLGIIGIKYIYLLKDISEDCKFNQKLRLEMLRSKFLKKEYKMVSPESYRLFFKECNGELPLDAMIKQCRSKQKRKALQEIQSILEKNTKQ